MDIQNFTKFKGIWAEFWFLDHIYYIRNIHFIIFFYIQYVKEVSS